MLMSADSAIYPIILSTLFLAFQISQQTARLLQLIELASPS